MHKSNTFLSEQYVIPPIQMNGVQMPKNPRNSSFPLRHVDRHLIHQCLGPPHSPRQTTARLVHARPRIYATKAPLFTMGCPKFTPFPLMITTPSVIVLMDICTVWPPSSFIRENSVELFNTSNSYWRFVVFYVLSFVSTCLICMLVFCIYSFHLTFVCFLLSSSYLLLYCFFILGLQ